MLISSSGSSLILTNCEFSTDSSTLDFSLILISQGILTLSVRVSFSFSFVVLLKETWKTGERERE
jgi:hypothetical protein